MDEKRIEIIEDIEGRIVYDEVHRKDIVRADVDSAEAEIARLEAENADYLNRVESNKAMIEKIKAEIEEAKSIIALADAKKAAELAESENSVEMAESNGQEQELGPVYQPQE